MPRRYKKVCILTGTRAEYGLLKPVMYAVQQTPSLKLAVCVAGMHLLRKFGSTGRQVREDGWDELFTVPMQTGRDSHKQQALGLARGVARMADQFEKRGIDIVLVLGDRIEALAAALAGTLCGKVVGHIHGGEVAVGQQDEAIRHAISKLAHLHFAATSEAARRLKRMGEQLWRIHRTGAPGLDDLYRTPLPDDDWIRRHLKMPGYAQFLLLVQHPVSRQPDAEYQRMLTTLKAAAEVGLPILAIWPNSDPGHSGITKALRQMKGQIPLKVARSLPREDFLKALFAAAAIVGNSSAGIIEAPAAGTPTVNIGPRQDGRQRDRRTVFDCPYQMRPIVQALRQAVRLKPRLRPYRKTVYGDGQAAARIVRVLAEVQIDEALLKKRNAY